MDEDGRNDESQKAKMQIIVISINLNERPGRRSPYQDMALHAVTEPFKESQTEYEEPL